MPQPTREEPRRRDRAVEDEAWMRDFLRHAPSGVFATLREGAPFLNTNLFVFDQPRGCIYLHTASEGATRRNVEADPRACFSVSTMGRLLPAARAVGFSVEYASVVVSGRAVIVEDEAEAKEALRTLLEKYAPHLEPGVDYDPTNEADLARTSVYRLDIASWSGKRNDKPPDFPGAFRYGEVPPKDRVLSRVDTP